MTPASPDQVISNIILNFQGKDTGKAMNCFQSHSFQQREIGGKTCGIRRFFKAEHPEWFALSMQVRLDVFVGEQSVPAENEQDALDETACHYLMTTFQGESEIPVATARALPFSWQEHPGERVIKIGRMAVQKAYRGEGLGLGLLAEIVSDSQAAGYDWAVLDAQTQALDFYGKLGFQAKGPEFLDENIPHFRMFKPLNRANERAAIN